MFWIRSAIALQMFLGVMGAKSAAPTLDEMNADCERVLNLELDEDQFDPLSAVEQFDWYRSAIAEKNFGFLQIMLWSDRPLLEWAGMKGIWQVDRQRGIDEMAKKWIATDFTGDPVHIGVTWMAFVNLWKTASFDERFNAMIVAARHGPPPVSNGSFEWAFTMVDRDEWTKHFDQFEAVLDDLHPEFRAQIVDSISSHESSEREQRLVNRLRGLPGHARRVFIRRTTLPDESILDDVKACLQETTNIDEELANLILSKPTLFKRDDVRSWCSKEQLAKIDSYPSATTQAGDN